MHASRCLCRGRWAVGSSSSPSSPPQKTQRFTRVRRQRPMPLSESRQAPSEECCNIRAAYCRRLGRTGRSGGIGSLKICAYATSIAEMPCDHRWGSRSGAGLGVPRNRLHLRSTRSRSEQVICPFIIEPDDSAPVRSLDAGFVHPASASAITPAKIDRFIWSLPVRCSLLQSVPRG